MKKTKISAMVVVFVNVLLIAAFVCAQDNTNELLQRAKSGKKSDRVVAISLLANKGKDPVVFDAILSLVDDKNYGVKKAAIMALGRIKNKKAVPRLIRALYEDYVAPKAVKALVSIGKNDYNLVDSLIDAYDNPPSTSPYAYRLRHYVVETLGLLKNPKAIPTITKSLTSDIELERKKAKKALSNMQNM